MSSSASDSKKTFTKKAHISSGSTSDEWLYQIRDIQLKNMSNEDRLELQEKADARQAIAKKAKKSRNVELRTKSAHYNAMSCSKALSAQPTAPGQAELATESMAEMSRQDDEWMYRLDQSNAVDVGRANDDEEEAEAVAEATLVVDKDDIASVLRDLEKEPVGDDAVAAKFLVYEKFSEKVSTIRSAVEEVASSAIVDLPSGGPREGVQNDLKKLDSAEMTGIYDRSRYWFVHDMMQQASKNCKTMEALSKNISSRLQFMANSTQGDCPVCMRTFVEDGKTPGPSSSDPDAEELVTPKVLSCCHAVCTECWDQWSSLRGTAAYCPLCRNTEFMEFLATSVNN